MQSSEQINEIAAALAKAQAEIQNPTKDSKNPHFNSKYADLAAGLNAVRSALSSNGIAVIQATSMDGEIMMLETRLVHSGGQWISSMYPVCKFPVKHQDAGSALTYSRRYSLFALVGIAGDDDDGNDASKTETPAPPRRAAPAKPAAFSREESAAARAEMIDGLHPCLTREDLLDWAKIHSEAKSLLTAEDQQAVTAAFTARQAEIKNPPHQQAAE